LAIDETSAQFFSHSDGISFGRMGKRGYVKPKHHKAYSPYYFNRRQAKTSNNDNDSDEVSPVLGEHEQMPEYDSENSNHVNVHEEMRILQQLRDRIALKQLAREMAAAESYAKHDESSRKK
jgi:hypothetical protein